MATRPLTERQLAAIRRLKKSGGRDHFSPDLAKQLAGRGLVRLTGKKYWRVEYNRKVPRTTLWEVELAKTT